VTKLFPLKRGPEAPLMGWDSEPVRDEHGDSVMAPVTPPGGAAVQPPGTICRRVVGEDGSVGEVVILAPE
jgi:hypothetical protein